MFFRRILVITGAVALLAGLALSIIWIRTAGTDKGAAAAQRQGVLVAARQLRTGTLLRGDDLRWAELPLAEIPPGSFARTQTPLTDVFGTATRREFGAGRHVMIKNASSSIFLGNRFWGYTAIGYILPQ